MDPFEILGIDQDATDKEVKRAYRAMASKYHPDVGGDAWVFQQVHAAYESVLHQRSTSASSRNDGASQQRSEPSTKSSTEGFSAKSGASKAKSGQAKSKEGGCQEPDIPSSPSSQMPSRGSSRQFSGQIESETRKSVTNVSHGLKRVFFGHLPRLSSCSQSVSSREDIPRATAVLENFCSRRGILQDGLRVPHCKGHLNQPVSG